MKRTPLKRGTKGLKRSGFKTRSAFTQKKSTTGQFSGNKRRSGIKRIGKIGRANLEANELIREYLEIYPIHSCELMFDGCLGNLFLQVAHHHQRAWYKGNVELLADPSQWVIACQVCHSILDARSPASVKLTDDVFKRLRP